MLKINVLQYPCYSNTYASSTICYGIFTNGNGIWGAYVGSPGKIVKFDLNLNNKVTYQLPLGFNNANEIAFDAVGNIYVTCWESPAKIVKFSLNQDQPPSYPIADYFQYPLEDYTVNGYEFGENVPNDDYPQRYHLGEDVCKPAGTKVYACANGVVSFANDDHEGYGGLIVIEHTLSDGTRYCSLYGHLDHRKTLVTKDDVVERGQQISEISGNPEDYGYSSTPHLHFGIRFGVFPGEDATDPDTTSGWYWGGYGKIDPRTTTNWWIKPSDFIDSHSDDTTPTGDEISVPSKIKVLMSDGTTKEMDLDEYVKGVVAAEMYSNWPIEALKAQAVAARTFAIKNTHHDHSTVDVCTDHTHCQAWKASPYNETIEQAVTSTHNVVITYESEIIREALFFGHCNG
ncbi:TPA: SpoIID/LytB domain-containing protein, partial [Candidatus Poribacteria bacterium]|nr:SpoIID/LytB domain-containing protein [Candidatus Poribacteria bacterium]